MHNNDDGKGASEKTKRFRVGGWKKWGSSVRWINVVGGVRGLLAFMVSYRWIFSFVFMNLSEENFTNPLRHLSASFSVLISMIGAKVGQIRSMRRVFWYLRIFLATWECFLYRHTNSWFKNVIRRGWFIWKKKWIHYRAILSKQCLRMTSFSECSIKTWNYLGMR